MKVVFTNSSNRMALVTETDYVWLYAGTEFF